MANAHKEKDDAISLSLMTKTTKRGNSVIRSIESITAF